MTETRAEYEVRYEAQAAEMRRIQNQAHEQIGATMRDVERVQAQLAEARKWAAAWKVKAKLERRRCLGPGHSPWRVRRRWLREEWDRG